MGGFEDSSVTTKPCWTAAQAAELALDRYGLSGDATELPSERDQNFRIVTTTGARFVLKVSNPAEDRRILDLQEPLGRFLGVLDRGLAEFEHPAADREFYWDLRQGIDVAGRYASDIVHRDRRERIEGLLTRIAEHGARLDSLPQQVIHGDPNDHNIMVDRGAAGPAIGLIDFGDMGQSWRIADLAILLAYAMLDKRDPLSAAARITGAYHRVLPLAESEIEALFPLACLRLCTSVAIAAHQRNTPNGWPPGSRNHSRCVSSSTAVARRTNSRCGSHAPTPVAPESSPSRRGITATPRV